LRSIRPRPWSLMQEATPPPPPGFFDSPCVLCFSLSISSSHRYLLKLSALLLFFPLYFDYSFIPEVFPPLATVAMPQRRPFSFPLLLLCSSSPSPPNHAFPPGQFLPPVVHVPFPLWKNSSPTPPVTLSPVAVSLVLCCRPAHSRPLPFSY